MITNLGSIKEGRDILLPFSRYYKRLSKIGNLTLIYENFNFLKWMNFAVSQLKINNVFFLKKIY